MTPASPVAVEPPSRVGIPAPTRNVYYIRFLTPWNPPPVEPPGPPVDPEDPDPPPTTEPPPYANYFRGPYDTFETYANGQTGTFNRGYGWDADWVLQATDIRSTVAWTDFSDVADGDFPTSVPSGEGFDGNWVVT